MTMLLGLHDLCDHSASALGTSSLDKYAAILLILDRIEKADIGLAAAITPSVLTNGFLI